MKKILVMGFFLGLSMSCQKGQNQLLDKLAQVEKRLEVLEKKVNQGPGAQAPEQASAYDLPVAGSPVLGKTDAPITITYFTDFQCPFCARAHESFVEKIFEDAQLKDKVKVVLKNFPLSFHKNADSAARAGLAAQEQGDDCYWAYLKKLYQGQRELSEENYKKWAGEVKCKQGTTQAEKPLNVTKFLADYKNNSAKYDAKIKADKEAAGKANVNGTPSFFVNGWQLKQRSPDAIKELVKQKNLVAGGL